jgi:hypothetical protein
MAWSSLFTLTGSSAPSSCLSSDPPFLSERTGFPEHQCAYICSFLRDADNCFRLTTSSPSPSSNYVPTGGRSSKYCDKTSLELEVWLKWQSTCLARARRWVHTTAPPKITTTLSVVSLVSLVCYQFDNCIGLWFHAFNIRAPSSNITILYLSR